MNSPVAGLGPKKTLTTCPYCGVGCGVSVEHTSPNTFSVSGDKAHPANAGKLCSKGGALGQTLSLEGRLLHPEIQGKTSQWSVVTDLIAKQIESTIRSHGPESVAFYVSGQLLTEDYYAVNKLIKGFIGTANIDTNSRLCMASSVAGHKRAFGSDTVPGLYSDIDSANLIVLTGSNLAWCHPILQQRITEAKLVNPDLTVVVIDPRRTATAELADIHLAIKPDTDAALFNGLLFHLSENGLIDHEYVSKHTTGLSDALIATQSIEKARLAEHCGLSVSQLNDFFTLFSSQPKAMTLYSQGVNQSRSGTDTVNSIINCHLATGRIGKPGMGPFSVTGQPNAMGGREVGGLSNMLAAHMDLENVQHQHWVQQFWKSPTIAKKPGLKAVDLFEAVQNRKIKFLWIMATNPVVSMPNADSIKTALAICPFVVVSDVVSSNDTLAFADVKLPAAAWSEKDGTVTNSERRISRQRAFRKPPAQAKPDWWAVCEVAKKLGYADAFDFNCAADIFREHAALSGYRNQGKRDFNISAYENISNHAYDTMAPFVWPRAKSATSAQDTRFFANGQFYTDDRRARIIPIFPVQSEQGARQASEQLIMNTGRVRDQWHTMSRTGSIPILSAHYTEPFIEIHPADAERNKIVPNDIVRVSGKGALALLRASITDKQQIGSVFTPMHWSYTHASLARVNALVPNTTCAVSGQPASKSGLVSIQPYFAASHTFAVVRDWALAKRIIERQRVVLGSAQLYWARSACNAGWRLEIASPLAPSISVEYWRHELLAMQLPIIELDDRQSEVHRMACYDDQSVLQVAIFVSAKPEQRSRQWVADQLGNPIEKSEQHRVIAGRPAGKAVDKGEIVCSCYMVGDKQIRRCIAENSCSTVDDVGAAIQAGTNCGSCRGELQVLLNEVNEPIKTLEIA